MTGYTSYDRNLVGEYFGIYFNNDLYCDPGNHIYYNGGCITSPGDPDHGWEYAELSVFTDHPVTAGVSEFLLNWGQSLSVSGQAEAIGRGTTETFGDLNARYDSETDENYKSYL